jgi:signal peptidase I
LPPDMSALRYSIKGMPLELPPDMPDVYYTEPRVDPNDPNAAKGYGMLTDDAHALVPEGHVLLLGDNSEYSRDGRWFGFMPHKNLLGRVSAIWMPYSRWHDFTGFTGSWWWRGGWTLLALYFIVRLFVGRAVKVYSDGLEGSVGSGEHLFIRFSLGVPIPLTGLRIGRGRAPQRGDVVLYRPPKASNAPELLLGIVAGLPEEKVLVQEGRLQIDGKSLEGAGLLSEPRFRSNGQAGKFGLSKGKEFTSVPAGHYFLLSNGSGDAPDSRALGWIARDRIVGTATRVWWPITAMRRLGPK